MLLGLVIPASASQAPVTITNDWELLAESRTGVVTTTSLDIQRGTLPGGTTNFNPTPEMTFEVVARHLHGTPGSSWRVDLLNSSGGTISSVNLPATAATYAVRRVDVTWPSADVGLASINLVRVDGTGLAGTLDIHRASLRIVQTGTILKTIGRFPFGAKQSGITATDWTDLADPAYFDYTAADFDPAPTIKLRAAGSPCGFSARIVAEDGTPVSGSQIDFANDGSSVQSSALTLADGIYRAQVKKAVCLDTTVATGTLTSIDVVLTQSTTDTAGIVRTVGYYPSVTNGVDVDLTNSGLPLDYRFRSPSVIVPDRSSVFAVAAFRKTGTDEITCSMYDWNNGTNVMVNGTWTHDVVGGTGNIVGEQPVTMAAPGHELDTILNVGTSTARLFSSYLKVKALLRDTIAPVITTALATTQTAFSPDNDGVKDTVRFTAALTDFSPITWNLEALNGGTTVIGSGSGSSVDFTWNGNGPSGLLADGTYAVRLVATDEPGNVTTSPSINIVLDTVDPAVSGYVANPDRFSPNGDGYLDTTTFSASFSESATWQIAIPGTSPLVGNTLVTSVSQTWNGVGVTDGSKLTTMTATDPAGNVGSATTSVIRDTTGPAISGFTPTPAAFSPTPGSSQPSTGATVTLVDSWTPVIWTLTVKNTANATVWQTNDTGSPAVISWDGLNTGGSVVPDGVYTLNLAARDDGHNWSTAVRSVRVDTVKPTITGWTPDVLANTLWKTPSLGVIAQDVGGAGISAGTRELKLDGQVVSSTFDSSSGRASAAPVSALASSVDHTLTLAINDLAGNRASASSMFRIIGVKQEVLNAMISGVDATTSAGCFTNCHVTFPSVSVSVGAHTTTLTSTLHAGTGHIRRLLNLSTAIVTWHLPGGVTTTSSAGLTSANTDDTLTATEATYQELPISIPASTLGIGDVVVAVPIGIPPGTTGTLSMASATQSPPCADSLTVLDPSNCGGPATSSIDPLNINVPSVGGIVILTTSGTSALESGTFWLEGRPSGSALTTLASGVVGEGGRVVAWLTAATAATTDNISLGIFKGQSASRADVATRSLGLDSSSAQPGSLFDLGVADVHSISTYSSAQDAIDAYGSGSVLDDSVSQGGVPGAADPAALIPPAPDCAHGDDPSWHCGSVTAAASAPACSDFDPSNTPATCEIEHQDFGVPVLRGYSERGAGTTSAFSITKGDGQQWQNGVRLSLGPFSVDGTTDRAKTTTITDTWPTRGDCWTTHPPGDTGTCDGGDGHQLKVGNDTWRWAKVIDVVADPLGPFATYFIRETLTSLVYNGGQDTYLLGNPNRLAGYYLPDNLVHSAGLPAGNYADYYSYAGTRHQQYETNDTYTNGASMTVSSGAFTADFHSTMTHTSSRTVDQTFTTRSSNAVGFLINHWTAYDGSTPTDPWPRIYWTCLLQPGQSEAGNCRSS